jgi:arginine repressor
MAIVLVAYPDAERDEIAAFIANSGSGLHSRSTISRRLRELKYSRKVASIEAYQAVLPANIFRKERFFNLPPPLGIVAVERRIQTINHNNSHRDLTTHDVVIL